MNKKNIGDKSLRELYSLSFSRVVSHLIRYYRDRVGGRIEILVLYNRFKVIRNGIPYETFRMDAIDAIFDKIDANKLRKDLKKM